MLVAFVLVVLVVLVVAEASLVAFRVVPRVVPCCRSFASVSFFAAAVAATAVMALVAP